MAQFSWGESVGGYGYIDISSPSAITTAGGNITLPLPTIKLKWNHSGITKKCYIGLGCDTENKSQPPYCPSLYFGTTRIGNQWLARVTTAVAVNTFATASWIQTDSRTIATSTLFNSTNKNIKTVALHLKALKNCEINSVLSDYSEYYSSYNNAEKILATYNITLNAPPTFKVVDGDDEETTSVTFDTPYVYAGLTTASVKVSDIVAQYGGDISSVAFTIGNQTVTGSTSGGTLSMLLNAGGTFAPTVAVTDSRGQTATKTLDTITVNTYTLPSVSFDIERTTSTGVDDDEGESAVVEATFNWTETIATLSAPTVSITDSNGDPVTATTTWYKDRALTTAITDATDWSAITANDMPVYGLIDNASHDAFDTQYSYQVSITPNDSEGTGTAIAQTLGSAFYTVDFLAGGHGIAFGQAATEEGFVCAMKIPHMIGFIQMFAGTESAVPPMWKMCNGQALNRTEYADLFAVIGTTYGTGDGSTTFNLPDLRDRFAVGAGSSYALNATGGSTTHHHTTGDFTLGTNHIPAHTHGQKTLTGTIRSRRQGAGYQSFWTTGIASVAADTANKVTSNGVGTSNQTSDTVTINATHTHDSVGGGQAHNHGNTGDSDNRPPYIGINYIIYAGK